jgi:hypothetical protein
MKLPSLAPIATLILVMCLFAACAYSTQTQPPPQNSKNDWAGDVFSSPVAPLDNSDAGQR